MQYWWWSPGWPLARQEPYPIILSLQALLICFVQQEFLHEKAGRSTATVLSLVDGLYEFCFLLSVLNMTFVIWLYSSEMLSSWIKSLNSPCRVLVPVPPIPVSHCPWQGPFLGFGWEVAGEEARIWRRRQEGRIYFWFSHESALWPQASPFPKPWFPQLRRELGGHKRFFELQNILGPEDGSFLLCPGLPWKLGGSLSLVSLLPVTSSAPGLCRLAASQPILFGVQGGIAWNRDWMETQRV